MSSRILLVIGLLALVGSSTSWAKKKHQTVLDMAAKDAPRVTKKPVIHHDDTVWIMH